MNGVTINLPEKVSSFVERKNLADEIKTALMNDGTIVVGGMQGSGKSVLVTEVVRELSKKDDTYAVIPFINCQNITSYNQAYLREYIANQLPSMIIPVTQSNGKTRKIQLDSPIIRATDKVLFVFDGVEDPDIFIMNLPPYIKRHNYIITSRCKYKDREFKNSSGCPKTITVGAYNDNEAVEFLRRDLNLDKCPINDNIFKQLASLGFNHPLNLRAIVNIFNNNPKFNVHAIITDTKNKYDMNKMDIDLNENYLIIDKTIDLRNKNINLNKIPGLTYQKIQGDGNCLYNAVCLYLNQGEDQQWLRNIVAVHIEHHQAEFAELIKALKNKELMDYLNDVRYNKEWADNIEIEVLMRVLNRPILIITRDGEISNPEDLDRFTGEPIFVYYNGSDHYDVFIHTDKQIPTVQIIEQLNHYKQNSIDNIGLPDKLVNDVKDTMLSSYELINKSMTTDEDRQTLSDLISYLSILYSKNIPYELLSKLVNNASILDNILWQLEKHGIISRVEHQSDTDDKLTMYNISPLFQFIWRNAYFTKDKKNEDKLKDYVNNALIAMKSWREMLFEHPLQYYEDRKSTYESPDSSISIFIKKFDKSTPHKYIFPSDKVKLLKYATILNKIAKIKLNTLDTVTDRKELVDILNRSVRIIEFLTDINNNVLLLDAKRNLLKAQQCDENWSQFIQMPKTIINHAYAIHYETLTCHGKSHKIDRQVLAEANYELGYYYLNQLSQEKSIIFFNIAKDYYEESRDSKVIPDNLLTQLIYELWDTGTIKQCHNIIGNKRKHLKIYAKILSHITILNLNEWERLNEQNNKSALAISNTAVKLLGLLYPDNTEPLKLNTMQSRAKMLAKAEDDVRSKKIYAKLVHINNDFKLDEFFFMTKMNLNINRIKLFKMFISIKLKIEMKYKGENNDENKKQLIKEAEDKFKAKFDSTSNKDLNDFDKFCIDTLRTIKLHYEKPRKILYYEKCIRYHYTLLKLYLKFPNKTDNVYNDIRDACCKTAKYCNKYFQELKVEDYTRPKLDPENRADMNTAKLFYRIAVICMDFYNEKADKIFDMRNNSKRKNLKKKRNKKHSMKKADVSRFINLNDKVCSQFINIALQMSNLCTVTNRYLTLSPSHPYVLNIKYLQDSIFTEMGMSLKDNFNWSAENHIVSLDTAELLQNKQNELEKELTYHGETLTAQYLRLTIGDLAMILGRFQTATKYFREYKQENIKRNHINVEALIKLGCAQYGARHYTDALETFIQVSGYFQSDSNINDWINVTRNKVQNVAIQEPAEENRSRFNDNFALFIDAFKSEFVKLIMTYKNKYLEHDVTLADTPWRVVSALANILPDITIGPPKPVIGATFKLSKTGVALADARIKNLEAKHKTDQFYGANLETMINKSQILTDDQIKIAKDEEDRLKLAVHNIACKIAISFSHMINVYDSKSMELSGKGVAHRIINHFVANENHDTMEIEDQIYLAIFKGKCDNSIKLQSKLLNRTDHLNDIIDNAVIFTPNGAAYYRKHHTIGHNPCPFFKNIVDKVASQCRYGYIFAPMLKPIQMDYQRVAEDQVVDVTLLHRKVNEGEGEETFKSYVRYR